MKLSAKELHFSDLNRQLKESCDETIVLTDVLGHRYIGSGTNGKKIEINGIPGNALGAYLNGSTIHVAGNAQDATGDTMNKGTIVIDGSSGDATGYAMRGGRIFIRGNSGYRAGIHMKAYKEQVPAIVIGGKAGCFLGEYQAGGIIVVLGLGETDCPVGDFCGTGMHGGKIFIRSDKAPTDLPKQVILSEAAADDLKEIDGIVTEFCDNFGLNKKEIMKSKFFVLTPNTKNPYKQLYTHN